MDTTTDSQQLHKPHHVVWCAACGCEAEIRREMLIIVLPFFLITLALLIAFMFAAWSSHLADGSSIGEDDSKQFAALAYKFSDSRLVELAK